MEIIRLEAERDLLKKELAFALNMLKAVAVGGCNNKLSAHVALDTILGNLEKAGVSLEVEQ